MEEDNLRRVKVFVIRLVPSTSPESEVNRTLHVGDMAVNIPPQHDFIIEEEWVLMGEKEGDHGRKNTRIMP